MKYLSFDLDVFAFKQTETADHFSVRVARSPAGEQKMAEAEKVTLPIRVRQRIGALKKRQLSLAEMIDLGEELGRALFPKNVRGFLESSLKYLRKGEEGLRINLLLDTYALAEMPWEYVYVPVTEIPGERKGLEGFLALNRLVSLVRYELQGEPLVSLDPGVSPIRMVALMASPEDPNYDSLDLDKERHNIQAAVADVPAIQPVFYPDATAESLLEALIQPVHIFHFSGHGEFKANLGERYGSQEGAGAVVLLDDKRRAKPFSAQKLALNLKGRSVRLAVLTACEVGQRDAVSAWAGVVTALTHAGIPAVVGMQFSIRDTNAVAFSKAFYRALAAGQPIDEAVINGRLAIMNQADENERDWGVPVLYLRAVEGVLFPKCSNVGNGEVRPTKQAEGTSKDVSVRKLREAIYKAFSVDELEILCSDIQATLSNSGIDLCVNLDTVGGENKELKVLNLIEYLNRRGHIAYLVKAVREARPGII